MKTEHETEPKPHITYPPPPPPPPPPSKGGSRCPNITPNPNKTQKVQEGGGVEVELGEGWRARPMQGKSTWIMDQRQAWSMGQWQTVNQPMRSE